MARNLTKESSFVVIIGSTLKDTDVARIWRNDIWKNITFRDWLIKITKGSFENWHLKQLFDFENCEFENVSFEDGGYKDRFSLKNGAKEFILKASKSIEDIGMIFKHGYVDENNDHINMLDDICFEGKTRSLLKLYL